MLQAGRSLVRIIVRSLDFFQLTKSFQPHYDPGFDSASNKNGYQKIVLEKGEGGLKRHRLIGLTIRTPAVNRLSRKSARLNISQPYRPPRPVTEIALLYGDVVCFL
jgi:hypothetical protein